MAEGAPIDRSKADRGYHGTYRFNKEVTCPSCGYEQLFAMDISGSSARILKVRCNRCSRPMELRYGRKDGHPSRPKVYGSRMSGPKAHRHLSRYYGQYDETKDLRAYPPAPYIGFLCLGLSIIFWTASALAAFRGEVAGYTGLSIAALALLLFAFYLLFYGLFVSMERVNLTLIESLYQLREDVAEERKRNKGGSG